MSETNKVITLIDGRKLIIREPKVPQDADHLFIFFSDLPRKVRNQLRYNVKDQELFAQRLGQIDHVNHWRLIALLDDKIVADGTMDREPYGWTRHVAHLRSVVNPQLVHQGLEIILFQQLVALGAAAGLERFFTEVLKEQEKLIDKLKEVGFDYEGTRRNYVKDRKGRLHDVVVLSNDSSQLWAKLAESIEDMDVHLPSIHGGA